MIEIDSCCADDVGEAAEVAACSHVSDPAMAWIYRTTSQRQRNLTRLFCLALDDVIEVGTIDVARSAGRIVAVAAWLPPGSYPIPPRRQLRSGPAFVRLIAGAPRATPRLLRFLGTANASLPAGPTWQLSVVGVTPQRQGEGIGSRVVRSRLDSVGAVHLETWNPANLPFYEALGLRPTDTDLPLGSDGPRRWRVGRSHGEA